MADEVPNLSPHDAAMVAKVDSLQATYNPPAPAAPAAPTVTPRPEHIPEKFWDAAKGEANVEAMAKSYAALEKERSKPVAPPAAPVVPPVAPPPADPNAPPAAPVAVDYSAITDEFTANGVLSEERYAQLEADGKPRAMVDAFIAGQVAAAKVAAYEEQAAAAEAFTLAGGQDAYTNMVSWAKANLAADDQAAFDEAVTGSAASRKQAIVALKAQYSAARGSDPKLIAGEGASAPGQAFQSRAEVTQAMKDPRYKSDPAYRDAVMRRLDAMQTF